MAAMAEIEAVRQRRDEGWEAITSDERLSIDGWKLLRPKGDDGSGFVTGDGPKS